VEKKIKIVKYLDPEPEGQWKAFTKFADGTFAEFKAQVMAAYPKSEEVQKGSVAGLKRKIRRYGPIAPADPEELLGVIRIINAEVIKLKRINPPIHTNRELVELFLGTLTPDFAARVAAKLSMSSLLNPGNQVADIAARNPEDMHDITEVMDMAKLTAQEHANPFGKFLGTNSGMVVETNVKLEEAIAQLTDTIKVQAQRSQLMDQRLESLQSFMSQPRAQPSAPQPNYSRNQVPSNHVQAGPAQFTCFYCGKQGHRVAMCEDARAHLDLKWIIRAGDFLRYPDGNRILREGNQTMKETVERVNAIRPGVIPMSKIQDKSTLYMGGANMTSYVQVGQPTQDEEMRALSELIQRVGMDGVQRMLTSTENPIIEEGDAWEQNFE
jgi:hypothetical protein